MRDSVGTLGLKELAEIAYRRDKERDKGGTLERLLVPYYGAAVGQPMCGISGDNQLIGNSPEATTAGSICCECGTLIDERLPTTWGGRPCHRACGEAAWRRAVAEERCL